MSRDAPIKADKDYSQILKEEFPKIDSLAQNDCNSALDQLLVLEKKTRQASDLASSKEVLAKIVDLLASRNKWDDLNEQLTLLSKKHGQLKLSIQYMIQKVMEYLKSSKSLDLNTRISAVSYTHLDVYKRQVLTTPNYRLVTGFRILLSTSVILIV